ncbi:MAG: portal protein, partial [Clostridia bacterium]|nr:portal protein [Clostridia bacterium]
MNIFDSLMSKLSKAFKQETIKEATTPVYIAPPDLTTMMNDSATSASYEQNIAFYNKMEEESPEASLSLDFLSDLACQGDDVLRLGHKVIVDVPDAVENKSDAGKILKLKKLKSKQKARSGDDGAAFRIFCDSDANGDNKILVDSIERIIKRFERRTKIKFKLRNMVRRMLKYGDNFEQILWGRVEGTDEKRITGFYNYPPSQVIFNLDEFGRMTEKAPYKIRSLSNESNVKTLEEFEMFRLQFNGDSEGTRGKSLFMPLRKTYTRLDALESGLVIGRLVRSHIRYLFKIDVSGMSTDKALQYIKLLKEFYSKKKMVGPDGNIVVTSAPLNEAEDIFLPTHKDKNEDVSVLESDPYISHIDDILHLYNKYIAGLRLTKGSVAQTGGSRNATAEQDTNPIRFVKSLQNLIRMALIDLYTLELKAHGITDEMIEDLKIEMPEIDSVSTVRKFLVERTRAEIIKIHSDAKVVSNEYLL